MLALAGSVTLGGAAAFAKQAPTGRPVTAQLPGTCHRALDIEELVSVASDSGPAVPCTAPHETETFWVDRVPGALAAARSRPNSQLLNTLTRDRCADARRLRQYLGAAPSDVTWGLELHPRFPRVDEWAKGARQLVCQASADVARPGGPTTTTPLAGVMATRASVRFRLCRSAGANLTCDRPHTAEATSPNVLLPPGPWPGAQAAAATSQAACRPVVEAYLEAPLASRPDLTTLSDGLNEASWNAGVRSANCYLVYRDGRTTRTTLRGGLR